MDIRKIVYVFRAIRLSGIARTIINSLYRDRIEQKYSTAPPQAAILSPGKLIHSNLIPAGIQIEFEHARAEVTCLAQDLIRVSWQPGRQPIPYTVTKVDWPTIQPTILNSQTNLSLKTGKIEVGVDNVGSICFRDPEGLVIKRDHPPRLQGDSWSISSTLTSDEHIYGLGERASTLNLRPGQYTSWNTDAGGNYSSGKDPLYIGTPIYLSLSNAGAYLVCFENSHRSTFHIGQDFEATFYGGMLRYYVIFGSLEQIYRHLSDLTGRPYMPPQWALGYHQSRWGYKSEADVRRVIEGFEQHTLLISAIHLDIDYMDGFRLFTFNSKRFPNIKKLTSKLAEKGVKVVVTINPAIKRDPNYRVYIEGLSQDAYCKLPDGEILSGLSWPGWCVFPDFTNPSVRSWWKDQYKPLLDSGISGIWHDMNEPVSFTAWGDKSFPVVCNHFMEGQGGSHLEAHNFYGLLMDMAGYEAIKEYSPEKRPWILSRSGWSGMQRYAWSWTGDTESSWESLGQTIPTILGLGMSGHGFSGVDIGGFSGSPSAELYLRWFQMATFLPFFRTHSSVGTKPREPWVYGEPTTSIIRKFLNLRYQLMPYLYTTTWESTQNGFPPIRPIFWENPKDASLRDIEDEFMLGEAILAAPILRKGEIRRRIMLPPGQWYSFWNDQPYSGPAMIEQSTELDTIPIFIKSGTILPMLENGQITLHLYPDRSKNSSSQLYSDAGDGFGPWRLDTFQMIPQPISMKIIRSNIGEYPFPTPKMNLRVHATACNRIIVDRIEYPIQGNTATVPLFTTMELFFD